MINLLKIIQDVLRRRGASPYQRLVAGFTKRHGLADDNAEKAAVIYLEFLAKQIQDGGKIVLLDQDAITALNTGGSMEVDEEKFTKLLGSDLVQKAVDKVNKERGK